MADFDNPAANHRRLHGTRTSVQRRHHSQRSVHGTNTTLHPHLGTRTTSLHLERHFTRWTNGKCSILEAKNVKPIKTSNRTVNVLFSFQIFCITFFKNGNFRELFVWHHSPALVEYWPIWARQLGSLLQLVPVLCVPFIAVIQSYRYLNSGPSDILEVSSSNRPIMALIYSKWERRRTWDKGHMRHSVTGQ